MTININNNTNNNIHTLHNSNNASPVRNDAKSKDIDAKPVAKSVDSNNPSNQSSSSLGSPSDSLTLTDSAINLKKLEQNIAQFPIVDMEKVEAIQNQIKDGSYQIDPDKIAEKFIEMEVALQS